MSRKTENIYPLLSNAIIYSFSQKIMSGTSFRKKIVKKYITRKNIKVLDIGCGPAEILNSLPSVKYYGYDINPTYIKYAKNRYKERGRFYCKKFTIKDIKKLPKFDYVLLLGILHHLNDKEIKNLMILIKKILKRKGSIITSDPVFIKNQNPIAKFIIKKDRGNNVRNKSEYIIILKKYFRKINSKIFHQKFIPYTWFVMFCKN